MTFWPNIRLLFNVLSKDNSGCNRSHLTLPTKGRPGLYRRRISGAKRSSTKCSSAMTRSGVRGSWLPRVTDTFRAYEKTFPSTSTPRVHVPGVAVLDRGTENFCTPIQELQHLTPRKVQTYQHKFDEFV